MPRQLLCHHQLSTISQSVRLLTAFYWCDTSSTTDVANTTAIHLQATPATGLIECTPPKCQLCVGATQIFTTSGELKQAGIETKTGKTKTCCYVGNLEKFTKANATTIHERIVSSQPNQRPQRHHTAASVRVRHPNPYLHGLGRQETRGDKHCRKSV